MASPEGQHTAVNLHPVAAGLTAIAYRESI